jgi:D-arabinose 1-dehydrogenase-like Zn-dependent alcohol dehydrogenase
VGRLLIPKIHFTFSALSGVRSMNEIFPLEDAEEVYEKMLDGKVRFRSVLATGKN